MSDLPTALVREIDAALSRIAESDPSAAGPLWGAMHKLLLRAKVDPHALMRVIGARDLAELRRTVARAKGEPVEQHVSPPAEPTPAGAADAPAIDPAVLQEALRLFRKRLRLMQLDADSRLGHGPTSGTGQHRIEALAPPRDYPIAVWEALVRAGKLRREGDGMLSIAEQPGQAHW